MIDSQTDINQKVLEFFKLTTLEQSEETQASYGRVIKALGSFLSAHNLLISDLSETMVMDWVVELLRNGLSPKNIKKYVDILGSLVNSAVKADQSLQANAVKNVKASIADFSKSDDYPKPEQTEDFVHWFTVLMRVRPESLNTESQPNASVWRDVILFSLLNGGMDLVEVARLTKEKALDFNPESNAVIERNESPKRRKYVFDLSQSTMTPNQFAKEVHAKTLDLLQSKVSTHIVNPLAAIRSMWIEMVLRSGATASIALGCQQEGVQCLTLPKIAMRSDIPDTLKRQFIDSLASAVVANRERWFAMRLRSRVTPEDIDKYILEKAESWKPAETFYPLTEITKQVGSKRIKLQKPYITEVLFFKSRITDILPLFQRIGDKAWCYRVTNAPGAPYASIPQQEMKRFQAAIGEFTPDTEIYPLDTLPIAPGDEVVVLGGVLAGKIGIVDKQVTDRKTGHTLYKVILQQAGKGGKAKGYEWRSVKNVEANLDPHQLSKATAQRLS